VEHKKLKVGDELICIKEGIFGYRIGKSYKIASIYYRQINIETDIINYNHEKIHRGFYEEVLENECFACIWDYFDCIKSIRNKKLKKLKLFSDEEKF
jgi:PP-loop superfamily ATP-utilizing enzyme